MLKFRSAKLWVAALAACAAGATVTGTAFADDAQTQALKDQMRTMQQQMQQLQQQLDALSKQQAARAAPAGPPPIPPAAKAGAGPQQTLSPLEKKFDNFLKGFYGSLDVSADYTTKGISNQPVYPYYFASGRPGSPFVISGAQKEAAFGRVGYLGALSSNGSSIGYRGTHRIGTSDTDFIYQVSTALDLVAAPGLADTNTKSTNVVTGAIGLGDTFIGFQNHYWGKVRLGELYLPYKTSTDRLNPFGTGLGNYAVTVGNTGGDNRVEFGSRASDVISYASPTWSGFSFETAYAFGQQLDPNSDLPPLGSPDCAGGNNQGSGNLFLNCDDGGYNRAYSADLKYQFRGLYLVGAYEIHKQVNRSSDGIGSNNPYYEYLFSQGPTGPNAYLLDYADYNAFAAEYPGAAAAGSPAYSTQYDVADEYAYKFGVQYHFDFGLSIDYLYEELHRKVPPQLEFQNERQRNGMWFALQQSFWDGRDVVAAGWGHAGKSVGDPGGQHNYNPNSLDNQSNTYSLEWWHKLDKQLTVYFDWAETINDGNAHYDIGAGGHGIKTDCHDATHAQFNDYSSAGPTTFGGCHDAGFSTGATFRF